jgi:predicted ribosome-associated RNA-binding protein Tma20
VYSGNKVSVMMPTLYMLFDLHVRGKENGLLKVYIKQGVEEFLFNGADLMWPGIFKISTGAAD